MFGTRTRALRPDARCRQGEQIEHEQLVVESSRKVEQELHCLEGLQTTKDARHWPQYTGFGAVADDPIASGFGPYAPEAGRAWSNNLQLTLVLVHARKHDRFAELYAIVVQQELGRKVVGAVDDEIVLRDQVRCIQRVEANRVGAPVNVRVQCANSIGCGLRL